MASPTVTVIGAGIAGLSAAYRLQEKGFSVKVLESNNFPGGRMTQLHEQGLSYNSGARLCYSFYSEINKLISDLGLQDSIVRHEKMNIICEDAQQYYSLSLSPGFELFSHPLLPWKEKLSLIRLLPDILYARKRINPGWMISAEKFDQQSLADYAREKVGPVFLEKFIEPVFRGTRSWDPEQISVAFFISTCAYMLPGSFTFNFKQGIGHLTTELAKHVDIEYCAEVKEIIRDAKNDNCLVRYKFEGKVQEIVSDITVCAVEGALAANLISEPEPAEVKLFEAIKYNPLGIVHAKVKTNEKMNITFHAKDIDSEISIVDVNETNGDSTLYCQMSPELSRKVKDAEDTSRLFSRVQSGLQKKYPGIEVDENTVVNQWIENMLPVFYPGYIKKIGAFQKYQEDMPRLTYYCGDYLSQALVEGACKSGNHVAKNIIKHRLTDAL
jgi:protoporphyrinogen/coproporphyrinogen III oxidase